MQAYASPSSTKPVPKIYEPLYNFKHTMIIQNYRSVMRRETRSSDLVMAVNLAARHALFLSFSPLSSSSSAPLQIQHNPSCSLRSLLKFPSRKIPKNPISGVVCASAAAADAAAVVAAGTEESLPPLEVREIDGKCKKWVWKGYAINYLVYPEISGDAADVNPPLLLVHGFGASIAHWRRNIPTLAQSHTVYAIDLIGFGASDKPAGFQYTMEVWAQLILDFLDEVVQRPTVLLGNSIGSLACVIAAAESSQSLVRALVLLNCAGGMNNKAIVDDWRIKLLLPLLWLFDFLLKQRGIAAYLFDRARQRENLRNVLSSVYGNKEFVDEDLVEIIRRPALDEGALDAFVSIITGPPGPTPVQLMPQINLPVLLLWGDQDPFTPIDGPVGKYFSSLPARLPTVNLFLLEGVGHCPHDDRPDLVHAKLLPWLANLPVP
ncbi:alpha/beta-Hydrolases superfamily protein [Perilla frutescens var. hirtella]|nr:alpha/beta-Hydrolases superfamily protein [Perilla frutescens var. hirtella]